MAMAMAMAMVIVMVMAYYTRWPPMSVHNKFQPNRSSRLAGYTQHIYECLVLLYR